MHVSRASEAVKEQTLTLFQKNCVFLVFTFLSVQLNTMFIYVLINQAAFKFLFQNSNIYLAALEVKCA